MIFFTNAIKTLKRAVGWNQLKNTTILIADSAKSIWSETEKKEIKVNYIKDLGYSAEQLLKIRKTFRLLFAIYASFTLLALFYGFYNYEIQDYLSAIVSMTVMLVCAALAFRYHFWLFQMRIGKLGCSLREWLNDLLGKGK